VLYDDGMAEIVMYTTSVCPYCVQAKRLLSAKGASFQERNIEEMPNGRDFLVELTGRRTVPQILINDQAIGGFDDLAALERSGELDALLAQ